MSEPRGPRSRSPPSTKRSEYHRDKSPHSHRRRHRHRHDDQDRPHKRRRTTPPKTAVIPFDAPQLSRHDLDAYKGLFASYLDIQKQKDIHDLNEAKLKGRWKSFYQKWNSGTLAAGWYDPKMKARIDAASTGPPATDPRPKDREHDSDDSDTGPAPPPTTFADIADRDDARASATEAQRAQTRGARNADRKQQRERLDELAPRAEPGTREHILEKKREAGDSAAAYRVGREGGGDVEVGDHDMMGSGGIEEVKAQKQKEERRKTEREQRREEIFQARAAEREERMKGHREKEEKTMDMFRQLARERFGSGAS